MITVTDNASVHLKRMLEEESITRGDAIGLRLAVDRGGCAGLQYEMRFAPAESSDQIYDDGSGVRIFVDEESVEFLKGCQIDYEDALNDSGFKIENPNAARSCGCGTSFEPVDGSATPADPDAFDAGEDCTTAEK